MATWTGGFAQGQIYGCVIFKLPPFAWSLQGKIKRTTEDYHFRVLNKNSPETSSQHSRGSVPIVFRDPNLSRKPPKTTIEMAIGGCKVRWLQGMGNEASLGFGWFSGKIRMSGKNGWNQALETPPLESTPLSSFFHMGSTRPGDNPLFAPVPEWLLRMGRLEAKHKTLKS